MVARESPLKGIHMGNAATVAIRELPGLHMIDLRVSPGTAAQAAVAEALGMALPEKPGRVLGGLVSGNGEGYAVCLSPDWWLLVECPEAERPLAALQLTDEHHFSVVEVSGQRTTIELEGPNALEVLAHLWEQDLRDKSFPVGSVSQGLMTKAPVIVWHYAPLCYRVMVRSSFAVHLWTALVDAGEEWR